MSRVILFRCHYLNSCLVDVFRRIQEDCSGEDVVLLYDATQYPIEGDSSRLFIFSQTDIRGLRYPLFNERQLQRRHWNAAMNLWYYSDYPILLFYQRRPEYDHYWQVEYDVRFTGHWRMLFDQAPDGDFVGTLMARYLSAPDWVWWREKDFLSMEDHLRVKSFFPLLRFSNRALRTLGKARGDGARGYCETTVPSVLNASGCTICDLGGDGELTPPAWKGRFYSRETFDWRPILKEAGSAKDRLYHPVRENTEAVQEGVLWAGETEIRCLPALSGLKC